MVGASVEGAGLAMLDRAGGGRACGEAIDEMGNVSAMIMGVGLAAWASACACATCAGANWEKSRGREWSKLLAMVLVVDSNEHGQREASGVGRIKMLREKDEAKVTRADGHKGMRVDSTKIYYGTGN